MLKKWGNLRKDWNPTSIKLVVNFSMRSDKVKKLVQLIANNRKARDMIKTIHFQDTFPFIYDVRGSVDVNSDYPNLGHDVDNFKLGATMAIKFQILSQNFKASKKVDIVKTY